MRKKKQAMIQRDISGQQAAGIFTINSPVEVGDSVADKNN